MKAVMDARSRTSTLPKPECVVKVGGGRGFIIQHYDRRLVVTAAHCLPHFPPAHAAAYTSDRTYVDLLGTLNGKNKVWAECLFVDPIADIAVLGSPDGQELYDESAAYDALVDNAPSLRVSSNLTNNGWVLTLDRKWMQIPLHVFSGWYGASLSIDLAEAGMSGSPILNDAGRAVGVVVVGAEEITGNGERKQQEKQGPQAILGHHLPGWLLKTKKPTLLRAETAQNPADPDLAKEPRPA